MSLPVDPRSADPRAIAPRAAGGGSVIHDLGYQRYSGARLGRWPIARSMFTTGLLNAYGIGRSGRAKALPMTLLVLMLMPAVIMLAVMVASGFGDGFIDYSTYSVTFLLLIVIFVAAQAPVLFSRDLRSGAIALYLARPLGPTAYALVRWASLFVAILIFTALPLLVLYAGAISSGAPFGDHTGKVLAALVGVVLLSAMLATISGLLSAFTLRRGLAIGLTIVALLISTGIVTAVKAITEQSGNDAAGQLVGLLSPFSIEDGIQTSLLDGTANFPASPDGAGMVALYVIWALVVIGGGLALLVWRYRKQAGR